jgi:plasmid stabilization system protein ParE
MAARSSSLIWTAPALDDLDDIAAFVALDSADGAATLIERALAAVERLRRFPASGRWVPELTSRTYREVIVAPLRIFYRREGTSVLIVHVMRGEQRLQSQRLRRK